MEEREQVIGNREQLGEEAEHREDAGGPPSSGEAGDELAGVRELILRAYPDVVAEMVGGDSVDALLASVPAAREAYSRVATTIQEQQPATIPTGSGRRPPIDPDGLSPELKIRAGLRQHSL